MDEEEIRARGNGHVNRGQTTIDGRSQSRDRAVVLNLQAVGGSFPILELVRLEEAITVSGESRERRLAHKRHRIKPAGQSKAKCGQTSGPHRPA
jgi:hypothetical protein